VHFVPWRLEEVRDIDSTNTAVAQRAALGEPEGLLLRADHQTAGRGRQGRTWEAPPAVNFLGSLLFVPNLEERDRWLVPATVALAARAGLVRLCGVRPLLKWPNDLVVNDRKLAGMLTEVVVRPDGSVALVVGLGLNLGWHPALEQPTTSVLAEAGVSVTPSAFVDQLQSEIDHRRAWWNDEDGRARLRTEIRSALGTLGRGVRVERAHDVLDGEAVALRDDGALVVETTEGVHEVALGDVTHLRQVAS